MQSKESIAYSAYSLVRRLAAQGLIYSEIRFAPQQHVYRGLTQEEFERLFAAGIIDEIQARAMVECAISHSFIGEEQKSELRKKSRDRME